MKEYISKGEIKVISDCIQSGYTVFDVGANVGDWSVEVLSRFDNITLFAFEPIPNAFNILQIRLKDNNAINYGILLQDFASQMVEQQQKQLKLQNFLKVKLKS